MLEQYRNTVCFSRAELCMKVPFSYGIAQTAAIPKSNGIYACVTKEVQFSPTTCPVYVCNDDARWYV